MISAALSGACIEWQNAGPQWRALLECSLPQRRVVRVVRQMPELPQGDVPAGGGPLLHLLRGGYRGRVQRLRSLDTSGRQLRVSLSRNRLRPPPLPCRHHHLLLHETEEMRHL